MSAFKDMIYRDNEIQQETALLAKSFNAAANLKGYTETGDAKLTAIVEEATKIYEDLTASNDGNKSRPFFLEAADESYLKLAFMPIAAKEVEASGLNYNYSMVTKLAEKTDFVLNAFEKKKLFQRPPADML
jgi:hypothetical protein